MQGDLTRRTAVYIEVHEDYSIKSTKQFDSSVEFRKKSLCIGLIGRIGSGKSTAAHFFKNLGAIVISADEINRALIKPGKKAYNFIVQNFGHEILNQDKTINTALLRAKMLYDAKAKAFLETLLHPLIKQTIKTQVNKLKKHYPYCIIEIPLIINKVDYPYIDKILCIDASPAMQLKRIMHKKIMSLADAKQIISLQEPRIEYIKAADDIIKNEGSLHAFEIKIQQLHTLYFGRGPY